MLNVVDCIVDGHNLWLVLVAGLICVLASHTAFSLQHRAAKQRGGRRHMWLAAAATAMGSGVWATHFVAMLAYSTPLPIGYDLPLTALSALIAVAMSAVGLWAALRGASLLGGIFAGSAIATMHYTGMAALNGAFWLEWDNSYVVASVVLGIALASLAFMVFAGGSSVRRHFLAVGIFAFAVCALHFTGMTAATLSFDPWSEVAGTTALERQSLAIAVAAVAALLLGAGILSAVASDYLADRNAREAERLRHYVCELEATKSELEATTGNLKTALEAAAASSQAKSQFLATMSHELRTPLNAIIGFSEIMLLQSLGAMGHPRYVEYAGDIHNSGTHLLSLINDVLDFSKAEAGRLALQEEPVDALETLRDCLRLTTLEAAEAGIDVAVVLPESLPPLRADRRRLKQIVLNLLSNALKFTAPGGEVRISAGRTGDGLAIAISDSGIGMTAEQIPVALEAFGQIDNSLSRKYEGTGLGLPLARHLAEAHGGSLTIDSQPGHGTTVTLHLPADRLQVSSAA